VVTRRLRYAATAPGRKLVATGCGGATRKPPHPGDRRFESASRGPHPRGRI